MKGQTNAMGVKGPEVPIRQGLTTVANALITILLMKNEGSSR